MSELKKKGLGGLINKKIENHILKDFYGMEIQITPYIIAHLKLLLVLKNWFYKFKENDRNQVYLANTLEPFETHGLLPFLREISEESRTANELKMRKKVLVITANPPYRGMSANKGQWIQDLLKKGYELKNGCSDSGYYQVDGKDLGERNPKWLQDDYVKFIRFAQWKIDTSGEGVVGYITNRNYLNNATFRGMRQSLLNSFDRIYILDLHGDVRNKEKAPDERNDENVFGIMTGVAIGIFIKNRKYKDKKVFYADIWGKVKEEKFPWLDRHSITNTKWTELKPQTPNYFFIPENSSLREEYDKYWKITDILPVNSLGIVTARDKLTIHWSPEQVWQTVTNFSNLQPEEARTSYNLGEDAQEWKVELAQADLKSSGPIQGRITPILYRPFDIRYTYYTGNSRGFHCRPRIEVMKNFTHPNLGIITRRQMLPPYGYFFVSNLPISDGVIRSDNKGGESLFPLYTYEEQNGTYQRKTSINPVFTQKITEIYQEEFSPEEIFYYIYAIFFSTTYRTKYSEFLKNDYPRIPLINDFQLFRILIEIGQELVNLHLMKEKLSSSISFDIKGNNIVKSIKYEDSKIYINTTQFFNGIPEKTWNFNIGAYQVLDKWLKSRKKRELSSQEIEQFIQIIEIINRTIILMERLDNIPFFNAPVISQ